MKLTKVLQAVGLNEKEARVYLALLKLKEADVKEISEESKIKRPTTYLILESLENKELVKQNYLYKKSVYIAEAPKKLLMQLNQQEQLVKQVLPKLLETYQLNKNR